MINVGPSYKYTFNVGDISLSTSSYSIYYIYNEDDMEYVIRYQGTEDKDSRKETRRKEG